MSKLNSRPIKDNILNLKVKSQLNEKKIKKIRKTLLSLALMDIKDSKLYNITVIKQDENENKMAIPTIIPLAINNLDFELVNEIEIPIEKDTYFVKKAEDELNKILKR